MDLQFAVQPDGTLKLVQSATKASGTPSGLAPMYGAGGLFGVCGMHPTLINAMVGPEGFEKHLTWIGSDTENPLYDALVYIGTSGYAQSGLCADCGTPSLYECAQTACFGRVCQQTNEHAFDQLGLRMNEGVNRMTLFGAITDPAGNVLIPHGAQLKDRFTLELAAAAYNLRNRVGQMLWDGNPAANLGGYWEFPGFDVLINTGKQDAITGADCDQLDSYISNYNAVIGTAGAPSIVQRLSGMIRSIRYRIQGAHLNPDSATIYLVMSQQHWEQVAAAWACEYGLTCPQRTTVTLNNDSLALADLRDKFMRTMMIPIDGKEYPVVVDNLIPLTRGSFGTQTVHYGTIYAITTVVNGETVTWGEFQNMEQTTRDTLAWFRSMFGSSPIAITDGGRFASAATTEGAWCFDGRILTKPRIIAKMPWTLGRLTNVGSIPWGTYPDVTGAGGLYELTGGTTTKSYLGLYGECGWLDEEAGA